MFGKKKEKDLTNPSNETKPEKRKKLKILESTQMWSPIKDIKDGIIITKDGRYVQILEFSPINFLLLPEDDQDAISSVFGAAIKTFPQKFQIKVLSRVANVESHVKDLQNAIDCETDPQCRLMQEQTITQIKENAITGVSRRFLFAFEYDAPKGLRSPSWAEIRNSIYFQATQIASALASEPCNNVLLSPIGDTEAVMDILYNCMCRKEAEMKSIETKVADTICTHIIEHGYNPNGNTTIPINDYLAPRKVDTTPYSYVFVDGKYYAFGYIQRNSYPTRCVTGWISKLVNLGEGIDLDMWIEQLPTKEVQTSLTYSMQLSHSDLLHKGNASADLVHLENKIQSENYIREGLANDQTLCLMSIMLTVVSDSLANLKSTFKAVQNQMLAYGLQLQPTFGNHDLALKSSLPICSPDKSITRYARRNILSGDLGSAYPFTSYEINDPGGIMLGKNEANDSPVFLDLFNRHIYTNGNMVIYGSSGAGKTYSLQCIALRMRQLQTKVILIAPDKGHEFRPACAKIGGTFISLAPGSPDNINVMEIRKFDSSTLEALDGAESLRSSILAAKIHQLHAFFAIIKPDITLKEKQILDEALIATYERFGITLKNKSLIDPQNPSQYKKMPILGDLDKTLSEIKGSSGLKIALARFITGSARNFNSQTTVNLDNQYVVIDVSKMPDELMAIAIFIATDYVYDTIRADRIRKKAIIMDELQRFIGPSGSPDAATFVLTLYKTVRAYNTIVVGASQDTNDFFALENGKYGKGVLANAEIKFCMKQKAEEIETLKAQLHLNDAESKMLEYLPQGIGLLIANRNHIKMKVESSEIEDRLITTDPERLGEILTNYNSRT